jgi:hypothetical protein
MQRRVVMAAEVARMKLLARAERELDFQTGETKGLVPPPRNLSKAKVTSTALQGTA